jgi:hypothetical protein
MNEQHADPCPCEQSGERSCFGPVRDEELIVRFVIRRDELLRGEANNWRLVGTSFASSDINGAKDAKGRRSVSSFRGGGMTPYDALVARACSKNTEPSWAEDPVIATALAGDLRRIVDDAGRREFCVYADATGETDELGVCESHASIRKSEPAYARHQRQSIAILRSRLSDAFIEIRHLISGEKVTLNGAAVDGPTIAVRRAQS